MKLKKVKMNFYKSENETRYRRWRSSNWNAAQTTRIGFLRTENETQGAKNEIQLGFNEAEIEIHVANNVTQVTETQTQGIENETWGT